MSASWAVPASAVSGIYFAHLVRTDVPSDGSHVFFVVRNDASQSDIYYQTSDTTWQAYNDYGGNSLYEGGPLSGGSTARAAMVSYNRPVRHPRGLERPGLGLQRRVPDGPLAGAQRLRRQLRDAASTPIASGR